MNEAKVMAMSAARVLTQQPDRVAAAWRRMRLAQHPSGEVPSNLLDDVVEPFLREVGRMLEGAEGSPWRRTRGVLRLSPLRGAKAVQAEFASLQQCLTDALEVLGVQPGGAERVKAAVAEALESSLAYLRQLTENRAPQPRVAFGGLVVELFERPAQDRTPKDAELLQFH